MPRMLKSNWPLILLVTFVVVTAGTLWRLRGNRAAAADQPLAADQALAANQAAARPTPINPGTPWVRPMIKQLGLTRDCLVALNVSKDQAQSLRTTVQTWCASNKASLAAVFAQTGPSRQASLAPLLAGLKTQVSAILTPTQLATWQNLQQYPDLPIVYRLTAPNGQQRAQIQKLLQDRWYARQAARTPDKQRQVQAAFDTGLRQTLSAGQMNMIEAYYGYCSAAAAATVEPAQKASGLPIPTQQPL